VIHHVGADGRMRLRRKVRSWSGSQYLSRVAGVGDVEVLQEPVTYQPGTEVEFHGQHLVVLRDLGNEVECEVSESRAYTRSGVTLPVPAGNHIRVGKSDLLLDGVVSGAERWLKIPLDLRQPAVTYAGR
jgi:hypothetical protein